MTEELGASLYLVPDIEDTEQGNPNDPFLANQLAYISLSTFALRAAKTYYANGFWKTICSNPDLLIQPNPKIRSVLEMLGGDERKQLFILTNGSWTHCNEVMKFAVGKDWLTLFDLVLTEAKKEIFFDELNDTPFSVSRIEIASRCLHPHVSLPFSVTFVSACVLMSLCRRLTQIARRTFKRKWSRRSKRTRSTHTGTSTDSQSSSRTIDTQVNLARISRRSR